MNNKEVKIDTQFIKLGQLLKLASVASQGSDAKYLISQGLVQLNNEVVYERGKKVYPNSIVNVKLDNETIVINVL